MRLADNAVAAASSAMRSPCPGAMPRFASTAYSVPDNPLARMRSSSTIRGSTWTSRPSERHNTHSSSLSPSATAFSVSVMPKA